MISGEAEDGRGGIIDGAAGRGEVGGAESGGLRDWLPEQRRLGQYNFIFFIRTKLSR